MSAVVRLPTAASRQVRQRWNKDTRALRKELPQFPRDRWIFPSIREAMPTARLIADVDMNAGLCLAMAIYATLDDAQKAKVRGLLAEHGLSGARQALALVAMQTSTFGRQWDIRQALDLIENGEA